MLLRGIGQVLSRTCTVIVAFSCVPSFHLNPLALSPAMLTWFGSSTAVAHVVRLFLPSACILLCPSIFLTKNPLAFSAGFSGANFVEDASGRLLHLDRLSDLKRRGVAARLLSNPGQKVRGKYNHFSLDLYLVLMAKGTAAFFPLSDSCLV